MGMTASGSAFIKTPFLRFASIDKLPLISTSQTEFSKSEIAIGGKGDGNSIEVALMLDVTGSMDWIEARRPKGALIGESRRLQRRAERANLHHIQGSKNDNVRVSSSPSRRTSACPLPRSTRRAAPGSRL